MLVIVGTVFSIPPVIMALCMTDIRLDHRFSAFGGEVARSDLEKTKSKADSSDVDSIEK